MSNLSDLLPAGAGAKSATFTASGTLATGTTVALQSDGTVKAISSTGQTLTYGFTGSATTVFETSTGNSEPRLAYDPVTNQVVIFYMDVDNSNYTTAVVGSVNSDDTFTFGSPTVVQSTSNSGFATGSPVWNSTENVAVVAWRTSSGFNLVACTLGTRTASFGTIVTYTSGTPDNIGLGWNQNDNVILVPYRINSANLYIRKYTISGTTLTYSAQSNTNLNMNAEQPIVGYDSSSQKCVLAYQDKSNFSWLSANVIDTSSGLTVGTKLDISNALGLGTAAPGFIASDTDQNILAIAWVTPDSANGRAKAAVLTVSGTTLSVGSATEINSSNNWSFQSGGYSPAASAFVWTGTNRSSPKQLFTQTFTVSGTTVTKTSDGGNSPFENVSAYHNTVLNTSNNAQFFVVWANDSTTRDVFVQVLNTSSSITNKADFVGITDEAIANAATGSVVVEGGVITNSTLIAAYLSASGQTTFESGQVSNIDSVYDPDSQKIIIAYKDDGNLEKGTAVVGTISGTSVTYGTPVIFTTGRPFETSIVYDTSNDKVVIVYRNQANSSYPEAIVGTVSGTSISFGTAVTIKSSSSFANHAVFDSTNNKVVVGMYDNSGNNYGAGIVGTVSGTSISFGSFTNFTSTVATDIGGDFDSSNGKVVFAYKDLGNSSHGTAVVGTVSGTSISFGTPVVFNAAESERMDYGVVFDSNANKIVIGYKDTGNSNYGTAVVGTVSGTSISFGSETVFTEGTIVAEVSGAFNSSTNQVVYLYQSTADSNYTSVIPGNVSGTSISFGSALQLNSASSTQGALSYDANTQKMLAAYRDTNGQSNVVSASQDLTVGSTYYVQNDGSLSTTSSSVTAGKALSSTTLLLKG